MSLLLSPSFRYFLICASFFAIAQLSPFAIDDRVYRFDRYHLFVEVFYLMIFVVGIILRLHRPSSWPRAVSLGAINGLLSGFITAMIIVVADQKIALLKSAPPLELLISLAITSFIFLTPVWGIVIACISNVISKRFYQANQMLHN